MPADDREERRIGDADLMDITRGDQARARSLRKSLQRLAEGLAPGDPLRDMAREVLSGRIGLREAARVPAYSEALGDRTAQGFRAYERLSPQERREQEAAARAYLAEQRAEIEQERRDRRR
ncbi:hypothetical protein [Streptomyces xanthii]|uniref:Uncharacterized protein n=1 Tax=Streptomyces xanthii TaxID=2768069 RepID=A0A7H1B4W4_9ACTN|nr:hypothetical protein [Streptomyces xanthii]QNS03769.1 hypothetical protein IAG42_09115 [Streptomyces xanthii]